MPTLAELNIAINSSGVREAKQALDDMASSSARVESQVGSLVRTALSLIGVYEALRNVRQAFDAALGEERITAGLTNLTGSAQQAYNMIRQLNDFSQNSQFALPGLEEDARMLTLMGINADQVVATLRNVALGLEAVGAPASSLNQVVMSLVRIREEGQLTRFTIQQLINAGIPAGSILTQAYGMSVPQLEIASRNGSIDAGNAVDVLLSKMGELGTKVGDVSHRVDILFAEIRNAAEGIGKDSLVAIINAFGGSGGASGALLTLQAFRAELDDIFNVLEGGQARFDGTNQAIQLMGNLLRDVAAVAFLITTAKLVDWALSLATNFNLVNASLMLLVAIDVGSWLDRQGGSFHNFVTRVGNAASALQNLIAMTSTWLLQDKPDEVAGMDAQGNVIYRRDAATEAIMARQRELTKNLQLVLHPEQDSIINSQNYDASGHLQTQSSLSWLTENLGPALKGIGSAVTGNLPLGMIGQAVAQATKAMRDAQTAAQMSGVTPEIGAPTLAIQKMQEQIDKIDAETDALTKNAEARKAYLEQVKFEQELRAAGLDPTTGIGKQLMDSHDAALQHLETMKQIDVVTRGLGNDFAKAFGEFITGAKNGRDAARDFAKALEQLAIQQFVEKPIAENLNSLGNSLAKALMGINVNPYAGPGGSYNTLNAAAIYGDPNMEPGVGSALGNVFWGGRLMPFASGGIVDGPTFFPMAGGLGLMGEAGPEAVMPLTRGPGGKLGVTAHGGGSTINQVFNIKTNDADSFRRSERQIKQRFGGR